MSRISCDARYRVGQTVLRSVLEKRVDACHKIIVVLGGDGYVVVIVLEIVFELCGKIHIETEQMHLSRAGPHAPRQDWSSVCKPGL